MQFFHVILNSINGVVVMSFSKRMITIDCHLEAGSQRVMWICKSLSIKLHLDVTHYYEYVDYPN